MNKMLFGLDEKIASRLSVVSVNKLWGEINENALDLGLKVVKTASITQATRLRSGDFKQVYN